MVPRPRAAGERSVAAGAVLVTGACPAHRGGRDAAVEENLAPKDLQPRERGGGSALRARGREGRPQPLRDGGEASALALPGFYPATADPKACSFRGRATARRFLGTGGDSFYEYAAARKARASASVERAPISARRGREPRRRGSPLRYAYEWQAIRAVDDIFREVMRVRFATSRTSEARCVGPFSFSMASL